MNPEPKSTGSAVNLIWNGGFESDILLDFAQFDWSIRPSDYAQISIDRNAGTLQTTPDTAP